MAKVFSFYNQSGGVSKTTLTKNIGFTIAKQGYRVLLIDYDPQGTLTLFCGYKPHELTETVSDIILAEEIVQTVPIIKGEYFDLLPANISLSAAEIMLVSMDMRDLRLKDALEPIINNYDYILIDCLPSLGLISYTALVASNYVIVPIECEFKTFAGTNLLMQTVSRVRARANRNLKVGCFIPTKYDKRRSQHTRSLEAAKQRFCNIAPVLLPVPLATDFSDASEEGVPLALYNPEHKAIRTLNEIAEYLISL